MSYYKKYSKCLERSVKHIFQTFLGDSSIEEVVQCQSDEDDFVVWIEFNGSIEGEIEIRFPEETLNHITKIFVSGKKQQRKAYRDIAGEIANQVTGTLANQLQYIKHEMILSAPEFDEDPIQLKTLYDNISLSFMSAFGGFDIETYFKDKLNG